MVRDNQNKQNSNMQDDTARPGTAASNTTGNGYDLSSEQWKKRLPPQRFHVLREAGTEAAFSGELLGEKRAGVFTCGACGLPLYTSETKFDSGSGWPSYTEAIANAVVEIPDNSHGMRRVEIRCSRCQSHLGHVFEDGPAPTGRRHCVNSLSLNFEPSQKH